MFWVRTAFFEALTAGIALYEARLLMLASPQQTTTRQRKNERQKSNLSITTTMIA